MKTLPRLILTAAIALTGCVERRITFTSVPPGALVIVSDKEIGRTPVTMPFTWYGDYDIIYRMDGYQTVKTHASIYPPWFEVPPIDLFSEIAPWTYVDERFFDVPMTVLTPSSDEELIRNAVIMEQKNLQPVEH